MMPFGSMVCLSFCTSGQAAPYCRRMKRESFNPTPWCSLIIPPFSSAAVIATFQTRLCRRIASSGSRGGASMMKREYIDAPQRHQWEKCAMNLTFQSANPSSTAFFCARQIASILS
jgi:hypothetical protein